MSFQRMLLDLSRSIAMSGVPDRYKYKCYPQPNLTVRGTEVVLLRMEVLKRVLGFEVSKQGLGCIYRPPKSNEEMPFTGSTFLDMYGPYTNEIPLCKGTKGIKDKVQVGTKRGIISLADAGGTIPGDPAELEIGIVAYDPLGEGFLSSGEKFLENLEDGHWRKNVARFCGGIAMQCDEVVGVGMDAVGVGVVANMMKFLMGMGSPLRLKVKIALIVLAWMIGHVSAGCPLGANCKGHAPHLQNSTNHLTPGVY